MAGTQGSGLAGQQHTVLIVEDEELSREMLASILEASYHVITAETGAEALDRVAASGGRISVILLDLMLPDMHGLDILGQLHASPATANIPIIVLTADKQAEVESLEAGAIDFIPKPYPDAAVIHARIRRTIALSGNQKLDDVQQVSSNSVAEALSSDYFSIYYVDAETDRFIEYSASDEYRRFGIEKSGEDFFGLSRENSKGIVYPEDLDLFLTSFTKENILQVLEEHKTFTLTYRLLFGDVPSWVSMKATLMEDDRGSHLVIGISDIDVQMRREQEYNYKLSLARDKANRDPLTGVKSKHAFVDLEERFDQDIAEGVEREFSVVVCDVNGLKQVNDTLGHKAGDQLIKDAAMEICHTFKHSPVFRTGGDEFVVVSEGQDHENRETLVAEFQQRNERNCETGGIVIACGAAFFTAEDACFSEVFHRADLAMYENKTKLKA